MTNLDPRSPLVLDTRDLGRRAGAMKELSFQAGAPADLGLAAIAVPEGSEIDFDLRLESVSDGVLISGTAVVEVAGECSRCLEPLAFDMEVDLQDLYEYHATDARGRVVTDENLDEEEVRYLEDDLVDLEPALRDAVVPALPLVPLCQPDCLGLCVECGTNLNEDPQHQHDVIDARWNSLADLATKLSSNDELGN